MEEYPKKVRIVFKDFPLDTHPHAVAAAEGARCAGVQGKFWAYHDELFASQDNINSAELEAIASRVGLQRAMWKECVKSGQMKAAIARDRSDGERFGVTGTPTFFVNGIRLVGAHPFENFKQVIDEELKRAGVK